MKRIMISVMIGLAAMSASLVFAQDEASRAYNFGLRLYDEGLYEQAIMKFKECLNLAPGNIDARYMVAYIFHLQGNNYQAIKQLKPIKGRAEVEKLWEKSTWTIYPFPSSITGIASDEDYLWTGTQENSLYRFDLQKGSWNYYDIRTGLEDNHITALVVDEKNVYVGTQRRGLSVFNKKEESWRYYASPMEGNVIYLLTDADAVYLLSSQGEVFAFEKGTERFRNLRTFTSSVINLDQDADGLYVQTDKDLLRYDKIRKGWQSFGPKQELFPNATLSGLGIDLGNIWLGTSKGEVLKYEKLMAKEWTKLPLRESFGRSIKKLKSDGRELYLLVSGIATAGLYSNNILKLEIRSGRSQTFTFSLEESAALSDLHLTGECLWLAIGNKIYAYYRN